MGVFKNQCLRIILGSLVGTGIALAASVIIGSKALPARGDTATATDVAGAATVGVDRIKYQVDGMYVTYWGTIRVLKGTTVSFQAIPGPSGGAWPTGKPIWGGTAFEGGSSGTPGVTKSITFNVKGTKTVTAECGNTVSINVVVYELGAHHVAQDYFTGRDTVKYGVGEKADLWWTVDPAGISAIQIGGLGWSKAMGDGSVSNGGGQNGLGTFTASDTNSTVVLRLTVQGGPSAGQYVDCGFDVMRPTDVVFALHETTLKHQHNTASCGILADVYLRPKEVSFKNIEWGEGSAFADLHGWCLAHFTTVPYHQAYGGMQVGGGNVTNGSKILGPDKIYSGSNLPPPDFSDGWDCWSIDQQWRLWGGTDFIPIRKVDQKWTIDAAGTVSMQKDGCPSPAASATFGAADSEPVDWNK
jgi:hypothetical protein